jgi:hypothetical protein
VCDARTLALLHEVPLRVRCWRFLDDHRALACVDGELCVVDAGTFAVLQTVPLAGPCHRFELCADGRTLVYATAREVGILRVN